MVSMVYIFFPVIEIHGNAKSRGAGGKDLGLPARSPACRSLVRRAGASAKAGRHRLKIDPKRSKNNKNLISLTMKVSLKRLMIRNPKDFGVWPACR
jgi:hypothetical protein